MNFLENIFSRLQAAPDRVVLTEAHVGGMTPAGHAAREKTATGSELLAQIAIARAYLRAAGLAKGDRCALVSPNSIRWAALDLAILAEGLIAVPLYARQAPAELAAMLRDAEPSLICCGDAALRSAISAAWTDAPRIVLFDDIFGATCLLGDAAPAARSPAPAPDRPSRRRWRHQDPRR